MTEQNKYDLSSNPHRTNFWEDYHQQQAEMRRAWDEFFKKLDEQNMQDIKKAIDMDNKLLKEGAVTGGLEARCTGIINSRRYGRTWKPLAEYRTVDYMSIPSLLKHWNPTPIITRVLMADPYQKPSLTWRIKHRIRTWWRKLITNK